MEIKYACGGLLLLGDNDKEWNQIHRFFEMLVETPKRQGYAFELEKKELGEVADNGGEIDSMPGDITEGR